MTKQKKTSPETTTKTAEARERNNDGTIEIRVLRAKNTKKAKEAMLASHGRAEAHGNDAWEIYNKGRTIHTDNPTADQNEFAKYMPGHLAALIQKTAVRKGFSLALAQSVAGTNVGKTKANIAASQTGEDGFCVAALPDALSWTEFQAWFRHMYHVIENGEFKWVPKKLATKVKGNAVMKIGGAGTTVEAKISGDDMVALIAHLGLVSFSGNVEGVTATGEKIEFNVSLCQKSLAKLVKDNGGQDGLTEVLNRKKDDLQADVNKKAKKADEANDKLDDALNARDGVQSTVDGLAHVVAIAS